MEKVKESNVNLIAATKTKAAIQEATRSKPQWVHFGGGNLYRGFHAKIAQELLENNEMSSGVIVCETYDEEVIDLAYQERNNDFYQVVMHETAELTVSEINATAESYFYQPERPESVQRMQAIFRQPSLQWVTLTITEKGYGVTDSSGELLKIIEADSLAGPAKARHTISILTSLLYERYQAGGYPLALVSTDNFSKNGQKLKESMLCIAEKWCQNKWVPAAFLAYLTDESQVSFPWTMIDRITPNPSVEVAEELTAFGLKDMAILQTNKQTRIAPFANTEAVHYLVVEDAFPNGRPPLEKAGVILTDRETVDKADTMKVTACLNPLHTALAVFGCLFEYQTIAAEMNDSELVQLIKGIGYLEGLPVVDNPQIIQPKQFIDEVIQRRLVNPMIPDTPQRIATDTSQKVGIRYGETIKKYVQRSDKDVTTLKYIPLAIAGWLRYLLAVTETGTAFSPSPDPLLAELQKQLAPITLGYSGSVHEFVEPILSNEQIFGSNLYTIGLGAKIETYFTEMLAGPGAIRQTLKKYLA